MTLLPGLLIPLLLAGVIQSRSINETEFVIETLIAVSPQVIKNHELLGFDMKALAAEVDYIIDMVNKYLATLKPYGLNIEMRLKRLHTEKSVNVTLFDSTRTLTDFKNWANAHGGEFDLGILFYGYGTGIQGRSYYNSVCKEERIINVQFTGLHKTALTVAHEIGHSLGSPHLDRYQCGHNKIMVTNGYYEWQTRYSSCTAKSMRNFIQKSLSENRTCMTETTVDKVNFDLSKPEYSQLLDVNKICQRSLNTSDAFFVHPHCYPKFPRGDAVCGRIMCGKYSPNWNRCHFADAPDGMVCDAGKRCSMGKCLPAPSNFPVSASVTSDCVFGDMKYVVKTTESCKDYIDKRGDTVCYDKTLRQSCCTTCGARNVSLEVSLKHFDIVVEALFVVEPQVISNYEKLGYNRTTALTTVKNEMEFMVHEINKYFNTLKTSGINIEIRMKKLIMMNNELFEDSRPETVRLSVFSEWLKTNKDENFDIAVLWHGYDKMTMDLSYHGAVCSEKGVVAVKYEGLQKTAATATKEIRLSLAFERYYGQEKNCHGFVMSNDVYPTTKIPEAFTICDVSDIKKSLEMLESSGKNCLKQTTTKALTFDPASPAYHEILDQSNSCMRTMNKKDAYFYHEDYPTGDSICRKLTCRVKNTIYYYKNPTDGVVCDVGKRCSMGKCLPAPSNFPVPAYVTSDCLFGDVKFISHQSCEDYLSKHGDYKCYSVKSSCCVTCPKRKTNIEGCEWGDKLSRCAKYPPERMCPYYNSTCCQTCRDYRPKRSSQALESWSLPEPDIE